MSIIQSIQPTFVSATVCHGRPLAASWLCLCLLLTVPGARAEAQPAAEQPRSAPAMGAPAQDAPPPQPDAPATEAAPAGVAATDVAVPEATVPMDQGPEPAATVESLETAIAGVTDPLDQVQRQVEAQEYDEAIVFLESSIIEIEGDSHRFDERLVRPLVLLGDAYAGSGQYENALGHYERALHLNRVNSGLNDPEQVQIVYREADALKALRRYEQANDREEYAYHVLTRAHGPLDEALLPGIYHLANWYERTSNIFAARSLYERAVQIVDAHDDLESTTAIPALHGIATSYRMERFPPYFIGDMPFADSSVVPGSRAPLTVNNFPAGEEALQRIVRIRQAEKPADPLAVADAVLDLADWYTLFDKPRRAIPLYQHAWELMAGIEAFDVVGYFAEPELLYFPSPGNPSAPPLEERGDEETGYVELGFDVTDDGYVRSLTTLASRPDGLMDFRVRKSMRMARYRPMLVEGVPVYKDSVTFRHDFTYFAERESATPATAATAPGH